MRLRCLIPALILTLAVGFLAMAGVDIVQSWREKQDAENFIQSDQARGVLLEASAEWAMERGLGYMLLFGPDPITQARRSELEDIATRADRL